MPIRLAHGGWGPTLEKKRSKKSARVGAPGGAQSIHRAIDLLVAVGQHNQTGSRLTDLAELTGLHVSTAHRLLNALVWEGMLIFDEFSKRYYLGVRVHGLVDSARYGSVQPRGIDRNLDVLLSTADERHHQRGSRRSATCFWPDDI
jgi:hypothetical protein